LLWVAASLLAALIYALRRHRLDDYQGRYRIWLWTTACCLLVSVNATTGLGGLAGRGVWRAAVWLGLGDFGLAEASIWWFAPLALAPAFVFAKALLDARECRGAMIGALLAAILGAVALCIATGLIAVGGEHVAALVRGALTISGAVLVVAALLSYARYVLLDAQGLLARKAPQIKNWSKTGDSLTEELEAQRTGSIDEDSDEDQSVTIAMHRKSSRSGQSRKVTDPHLAMHSTERESTERESVPPAGAGFSRSTAPAGGKMSERDDEITTLQAKNELSKAERRRLKKLLRRRQAA